MLRHVALLTCATIVMTLVASNVMAACTYGEAVMALKTGNSVRGLALMNMAAKDGDWRAIQFLATSRYKNEAIGKGELRDAQGIGNKPPRLDVANESIRPTINID